MAKKIIKGTIGKLGVFGKKKKAVAAPAEGQPIVTALGEEEKRKRVKGRPGTMQAGTILDQALGPDGRAKLGG